MNKTNKKKQLRGTVVSNKMEKAVKVRVDRPVRHPVYEKIVNDRKVFFARTDMELEVGDEVVIEECKPYSKKIRWIVKEKNGTEGK